MDLGIVIVSYNTCQLVLDCLASVYQALEQEGLRACVCVVDNASSDDTPHRVREVFPQVVLIAKEENVGFARGTNEGVASLLAQEPTPRYLLLLNPDTLVQPMALSQMVAFLEAHPKVGAVGPRLSYGDGTFQHSAFRFPTVLMALFDFWPIHYRVIHSRLNGRYPRHLYEAGVPFPIDHPLGAAIMIRRETWEDVGPLDEGYFMYCEEIDWCLRARRHGWEIYCVPQAHIVHLEGQSTRQFREKMFIALWRSRFRLFEKHYSPTYRALVRGILKAGLRQKSHQVRRQWRRGEISAEAAEKQLAAYRAVMEM